MAFLKGLTAEQMEVRVMDSEDAYGYKAPVKEWERSLLKSLQTDLRVDNLLSQAERFD